MRWHSEIRNAMVWHGILFKEPNPTGSRPSDVIGCCEPCSQDSGGDVDRGDDDDVYYYIGERIKLEREAKNMGV